MKYNKILVIVCLIASFYSCRPDILSIKSIAFRGSVLSKYEDKPCFGSIIIVNDEKVDTIKSICSCTPANKNVWDYVVPGDMMYKDKGSLTIRIVRKNSLKRFDYPSCYQ
jgi:hypothetical protein